MKWFQHQSDASDDIKIKRLEYKFGLSGYAVFFKLLEKVAKEGKNNRLDLKKYPIGFLAKEFMTEESKMNEYLTEMNELRLITYKNTEIGVTNMKKYTDNWNKRTTKKLPSNYGATTERREEIRIDKNKEEESVSSLNNKTKRFYKGLEMRFSQNRWWVIPKDGGEWLKYAGKLSETEIK